MLLIEHTVDLVIFACLDFREFVIFGLFAKSRIREILTSMIGSAIIIILFARLAKLAKIKTSRILSDLQYCKNDNVTNI